MGKILTIMGVLILLVFIGTCAYFVAGVSATYPPLEEFSYPKKFPQLISNMSQMVSADNRLTYVVTDTTGDRRTGYRYYISVKFKRRSEDLEYQFFYDKTDHWFGKNITEIGLVFAYDQTHNTGGYSYENEGKRTRELVQIFKNEILGRLLE